MREFVKPKEDQIILPSLYPYYVEPVMELDWEGYENCLYIQIPLKQAIRCLGDNVAEVLSVVLKYIKDQNKTYVDFIICDWDTEQFDWMIEATNPRLDRTEYFVYTYNFDIEFLHHAYKANAPNKNFIVLDIPEEKTIFYSNEGEIWKYNATQILRFGESFTTGKRILIKVYEGL